MNWWPDDLNASISHITIGQAVFFIVLLSIFGVIGSSK